MSPTTVPKRKNEKKKKLDLDYNRCKKCDKISLEDLIDLDMERVVYKDTD